QLAALRRLDLAAVLAQLWRYPGQPQLRVDLFFCRTQDLVATVQRGEAVLVQGVALLERDLTQVDVVLLAARKVGQQRAVPLRRQHAQVNLLPGEELDGGLRRAGEIGRAHV